MSLTKWLLLHSVSALFWIWILAWGGASRLEGWRAFFLVNWFTAHWNAEQLRLYALCILFFQAIWFVVGLFKPEFRWLG